MRKFGLVLCFLIVPSVLAGAYYGPTVRDWVWPQGDPVEPFVPAKIVAPATVAPYRLVRATIEGPASNAYDVSITPDVDHATDDGDDRTLEFVGPPAVYTIDVVQVGATGDPAKPFRIARQRASVTIGTPPPPVPPGPTPPPVPPPAPTFPDEKLGYSTAIYKASLVVVDEARATTAKALAANFAGIASAIAAGTMPNAGAILAETKKRNEQTAGPKRSAWLAAFSALKTKLDADGFDGSRPRPVADYKQAWDEIAVGLEAVK